MSVLTGTIQLRKDTEANFTSSNPILLNGEVAISTDNTYVQTDQPRFKIGNGVDTWTALDYQPVDTQLTALVVNGTGGNLLRSQYRVVKVTSAQGQRLQVNLAQANNDPNSADTLGIVAEDISNNQDGYVMLYGQILNINTTGSLQGETWNDGDLLYLSATVAGGITNVRPIAPNHSVSLGYVEYAHQNNGKIFVKIQNGYELNELHDLYVPNPVDGDTIAWSSGNTRYENKSVNTLIGYTPAPITDSRFVIRISDLIRYTNTGNTNENVLTSLLITGGTLTNKVFEVYIKTITNNSANNKTFRMYFNSTPNLVGSPILAATYTATTAGSNFQRLFKDLGTTIRNYIATTLTFPSFPTSTTATTTENTLSVNLLNNIYIVITAQNALGSDSAIVDFCYFQNIT